MAARKKRANGLASREAILDAAAEIAGERGYEGTGIKAVSERSGLPASSIYWHFENKDELIAAVIDRSFAAWVEALDGPFGDGATSDPRQAFVESFRASALQLTQFPDFLRLGLMLMLEHRPNEPAARQRFQAARSEMLERLRRDFQRTFDGVGDDEARRLATLALAGADGLFIAAESGESDLVEGFETLAHAIYAAATTTGWAPAAPRPAR
jgi:AcrR family transcriptional regulator